MSQIFQNHEWIKITGAREGNLNHLSVDIPRNALVVLTGLSGSGKSTLAIETLYQECQRQYLEAIGYQGIQKPKVDAITNLSPAVRITQSTYNRNPRSTVGTVTDIYTELRMVYEKLSKRQCPSCEALIKSSDCREELVTTDDSFVVYMYCDRCGHKMEKLTRSHFSANTREGACEVCHGLGEVLEISLDRVINPSLSLEEGAVDFWDHAFKEYQISSVNKAFEFFGLELTAGRPVAAYSEGQLALLLYGAESAEVRGLFPDQPLPKKVSEGRFEGVLTTLWRRLSEKGGLTEALSPYFHSAVCTACRGEKLSLLGRTATVLETRLPELSVLSLEALRDWLRRLEPSLSGRELALVAPYIRDLDAKLRRIVNVGLGYLSLDRQTMTLSGGEGQRIKLAAVLDSTMTGLIYIMDEPTIGLHPKDTAGILNVLKALRNLGNTVLVIEHDPEVIRAADYIIDLGPGSGRHGGEVVGTGTYEALLEQPDSVTGRYLKRPRPFLGASVRKPAGQFSVRDASRFNLKHLEVRFPAGCLTCVTGVSGSGKSTLVFEELADRVMSAANGSSGASTVIDTGDGASAGVDPSGAAGFNSSIFDDVITVEQAVISRMKRSNVATYSGLYSEVRKIFGGLSEAKVLGLDAKHFSFNTKGGRCEHCEGLGYVESNLLFFENIDVVCPVCGGNQFNDEVLSVAYQGHSIKGVLKLTVDEAMVLFRDKNKLMKHLKLLKDVGLGYLELGQTLTTLSGGEAQRLKLAKSLTSSEGRHSLYLIDEPTTGLHPLDVENFLVLLNRMVDAGNTVIVVEHNLQVIGASDWVIDLGPLGGDQGGWIVAEGTPREVALNPKSYTGQYLRQAFDLGDDV
ncbi:excinuclease ABC subunit UvrA [Acidaminobacter hydrogenoformans]|uniref:UvrABC system protein A n=1 Tax=Acidaminobacter hydrogenoformans DSM 2784 TaxID=1120920 RepID=A0A1G5S630_9FIRM|nr:excinuclease ABC subunit UvrA [Acidaminobacter hydrogenoformans]SCZ81786.1 excinuclease ABC subunit A [Acidaminobacter hydrogenoformans DSM 2784]